MALMRLLLPTFGRPAMTTCHGLDQVQPGRGMGQQRFGLPPGGRGVAGFKEASICSIAFRNAPLYWSSRIAAVRVVRASAKASSAAAAIGSASCLRGPILPGDHAAAAADKQLLQPGDRGRSAVAMQFDHVVRDPAEDDFLAAQAADDDLP